MDGVSTVAIDDGGNLAGGPEFSRSTFTKTGSDVCCNLVVLGHAVLLLGGVSFSNSNALA
jgi:hypothetical protein